MRLTCGWGAREFPGPGRARRPDICLRRTDSGWSRHGQGSLGALQRHAPLSRGRRRAQVTCRRPLSRPVLYSIARTYAADGPGSADHVYGRPAPASGSAFHHGRRRNNGLTSGSRSRPLAPGAMRIGRRRDPSAHEPPGRGTVGLVLPTAAGTIPLHRGTGPARGRGRAGRRRRRVHVRGGAVPDGPCCLPYNTDPTPGGRLGPRPAAREGWSSQHCNMERPPTRPRGGDGPPSFTAASSGPVSGRSSTCPGPQSHRAARTGLRQPVGLVP